MAGADEGQRLEFTRHPLHQQLHLAATLLLTEQPCLDHARVVHHQEIVGAQQGGQIGKFAVVQRAGRLDVQQPAAAAHRGRKLGNQVGRKVEVEIGNTHGARL